VLLSDIPTLYYRAGNRHHRAATIGGLPIHPGCRGLSTTNNQFVHCLCTLHILTRYLLQTLSACRSQGLFWLRWKKPDAVRPFKGRHQNLLWLIYANLEFFNSLVANCLFLLGRCCLLWVILFTIFQSDLFSFFISISGPIPASCKWQRRYTSSSLLFVSPVSSHMQ
jgi:hypothetical protein